MIAFIGNPLALLIALGMAASLGVFIFALLRLAFPEPDPEELAARALLEEEKNQKRGRRDDSGLADSELLQRAIDVVTNLADRQGVLGSIERMLQAGDVLVRPGEALSAYGAAIALVGPAAWLLTGNPIMALILTIAAAVVPVLMLRRRATKRQKLFVEQLPEALTMLSGSLKAGRSLGQALESVAQEVENPMGRELKKIVAEVRLGWPMADAMQEAADRLNSADFAWAVTAIKIQSEVGGNLSELLETVAETMRSRSQLHGEVRALTAEGRASAMILTVMPVAMGVALYLLNPDYIGTLFESSTGQIMLGVAAAMIGVGYVIMNKVVKVDV